MSTTESTTDEFEVARDKALQALDGGLRLRVRDGKGTRKQIIDEAVLQIARRIDVIDRLRERIERLTAENADLKRDLGKAERHDADIRLEAERDVRAELAAKAGA